MPTKPIDYRRLAQEALVGFVMGLALLGCLSIAMH
jgi:hypothetical protein